MSIDAEPTQRAEKLARSSAPVTSDRQPTRILIADDSDVVRDCIRVFLERWGYSCTEAADGTEAITKARQFKPDLIVMDLAMPGVNGIEATSVIRTTMPKVPIIPFTMYDWLAKSLKSKLAINTVVSKADGLKKLVECIGSVLGSTSLIGAK
jgi:two-component system, OmpR family, response regulator